MFVVVCRWVMGAAFKRNNLPHLYSHTGGNLHIGPSEVIAMCVVRFFKSTTWSSRRSSDLARFVSRCVAGLCCPGRDGFSEARMLVRRWWICRSSPTLSMGGGGSWPETARDISQSTCHIDMYLAASSRPVHRFTNPRCRWCFLGFGKGGGSTSLLACVSAALELDGGRWLRGCKKS
jgi:hypothetical protein